MPVMDIRLKRALLIGAAAAVAAYTSVTDEEPAQQEQPDHQTHEKLTNQLCDVDTDISELAEEIEVQLQNLPLGTSKKQRKKLQKKADSLHLAAAHLADAQRHLDQALYY